ncbi:carbohydrate esterase family 4 protein [Coniochaeta ligniaria NRRL 30616]|uniref:Carbohydrate esterase family 4 protein n=1 Tax=Coniochaeta ligniaria NRRL 30616 TaxID=1408157 RepID=A0A1J7JWD9_9PEZI|nr:carbohydrate esterase family 4 protein [Coniochaeta ligniaria NRRL 30616]
MMTVRQAAWVAALYGAAAVSAICTSNLQIDNFALFPNGTNSLASQASDDGTMAYITSSSANGGSVTFVPKTQESYFYESFVCRAATTEGYGAVSFTLQGPVNGSVAVELQTQTSCSATNHTSSYNVLSGLTGTRQQFTLPLDSFVEGVNPNAVVALAFSQFITDGVAAWTIGNIQFVCGAAPTTSVPTAPVPTSTPTVIVPTSTVSNPNPTSSACTNLLIDDWESQSRLTFLNYNAMQQSTSDDATMSSIVVDSHRVMLTPKTTDSYFYSQFGCVNAKNIYGGISFRVRAAAGTTFAVTLTSVSECGGQTTQTITKTSTQLNWAFDGTERLYWFPFSVFTGIDVTKLQMIYFSNFNAAVILGPMSFYCGSTASEYVLPATAAGVKREVSAGTRPAANGVAFVLDSFTSGADLNSIGQWHGGDDGMKVTIGSGYMMVRTNDSDLGWNTQLTDTCVDFNAWKNAYLHVQYSGSNKFSIALQQHNEKCNADIQPYPETWDSVEAARYASTNDIYVPVSHFNINMSRVIGFNFKGFYTTNPTVFYKVEVVNQIPAGWKVPDKLPSGQLVFACKRPNSFAFAIDDGEPALAQQVMDIVKSEGVNVTFFTVGLPLLDPTTNLSNVYKDMQRRGHQIALHSYTHPKMEGLPDVASIDWEYDNDIAAVKKVFNGMHTPYFRPPFGTEGARMRQRLVQAMGVPDPYIVQWSIDVEDWLWAESKTPQKQLDAFKRDLAKGGNLVVMHYLYPTTVGYLRQFIRLAKASGKQLMRVDQCMMDPNAPPL